MSLRRRLALVTALAASCGITTVVVVAWVGLRHHWRCDPGKPVDAAIGACATAYDGGMDGVGDVLVALRAGGLVFAALLVIGVLVGFRPAPPTVRGRAAAVLLRPAVVFFAWPGLAALTLVAVVAGARGSLLLWVPPVGVALVGVLSWWLTRRTSPRVRIVTVAGACVATLAALAIGVEIVWLFLGPMMIVLAAFPVAAAALLLVAPRTPPPVPARGVDGAGSGIVGV